MLDSEMQIRAFKEILSRLCEARGQAEASGDIIRAEGLQKSEAKLSWRIKNLQMRLMPGDMSS